MVGGEGRLPRDAAVEQQAEGEDVRAGVEGALAAHLLGGHVPERSEDGAGAGERGDPGELSGDAEVQEARALRGGPHQEDVGGLHVAVHDAARVGRAQGLGDAADHRHALGEGELARASRASSVSPSSHSIARKGAPSGVSPLST